MGSNGSPPDNGWIDGLLDQHEGGLLRYAQRITGSWERAQEVVQDTFLKLVQRERAEVEGHVVEWLFTVCRNRALDVRRKETRMAVSVEAPTDSVTTECPPDEMAETREMTACVVGWVDDLPKNQQEVVRLRFQSGLSYRQIGEVTGLTVSNVGFLLHRGMTTLRERMRRFEADVPMLRVARKD